MNEQFVPSSPTTLALCIERELRHPDAQNGPEAANRGIEWRLKEAGKMLDLDRIARGGGTGGEGRG